MLRLLLQYIYYMSTSTVPSKKNTLFEIPSNKSILTCYKNKILLTISNKILKWSIHCGLVFSARALTYGAQIGKMSSSLACIISWSCILPIFSHHFLYVAQLLQSNNKKANKELENNSNKIIIIDNSNIGLHLIQLWLRITHPWNRVPHKMENSCKIRCVSVS